MATHFEIDDGFIAEQNRKRAPGSKRISIISGRSFAASNVDIEDLIARGQSFALPFHHGASAPAGRALRVFRERASRAISTKSWKTAARFSSSCAQRRQCRLHIPWDKPDDATKLREFAGARGLSFDAMNSNTFQDQPGQKHSYKFGSLTHPDKDVRAQAIEHNIECIEIGKTLGSKAHTVWIGDGGNFPGQQHFRRALERLSRKHARDLRGAARRLAPVHRTQVLRAGFLFDGDQ